MATHETIVDSPLGRRPVDRHGAPIRLDPRRSSAGVGELLQRHLNESGHLMAVKPRERPFVTAEMIRRATFTGTEPDLLDRIAALRDAGYTQFTIQLVPGQETAIEDWARLKAEPQ
jgi:hypothetical protein